MLRPLEQHARPKGRLAGRRFQRLDSQDAPRGGGRRYGTRRRHQRQGRSPVSRGPVVATGRPSAKSPATAAKTNGPSFPKGRLTDRLFQHPSDAGRHRFGRLGHGARRWRHTKRGALPSRGHAMAAGGNTPKTITMLDIGSTGVADRLGRRSDRDRPRKGGRGGDGRRLASSGVAARPPAIASLFLIIISVD